MKILQFIINIILLSLYQFTPNHEVEAVNIVFFTGSFSSSHRNTMWPLVEALAEGDHAVTFVSPYVFKTPSNPKVFDYVPTKLQEWMKNFKENDNSFEARKSGKNLLTEWFEADYCATEMCKALYSDEKYLEWVKESKVDLLFVDGSHSECAYGMGEYWGSKIIIIQSTSFPSHFIDSLGLPDETNWLPTMELAFSTKMSILDRISNKLFPVVMEIFRKWGYFPILEEITRKYLDFDGKLPHKYEDWERNVDMIFLNVHYSHDYGRSLPPFVIPIGGISWTNDDRQPLPAKLEQFISKRVEFVYVSFGNYLNFEVLDDSTKNAVIGAFRNFPNIQFVWEMEEELSLAGEFPDKNVFIDKRIPQKDILAHPKLIGFITHSGLVETQDAIQNGVPIIALPIYGDQDYNAEWIHQKECGIRLEITELTQKQLEISLYRIIHDKKYRENMRKISSLYKDRPSTPLNTALFWTEYVLRHEKEELALLKPLGMNQPWWVKRGLDVYISFFGTVLLVAAINIFLSMKSSNALQKMVVDNHKKNMKKQREQ